MSSTGRQNYGDTNNIHVNIILITIKNMFLTTILKNILETHVVFELFSASVLTFLIWQIYKRPAEKTTTTQAIVPMQMLPVPEWVTLILFPIIFLFSVVIASWNIENNMKRSPVAIFSLFVGFACLTYHIQNELRTDWDEDRRTLQNLLVATAVVIFFIYQYENTLHSGSIRRVCDQERIHLIDTYKYIYADIVNKFQSVSDEWNKDMATYLRKKSEINEKDLLKKLSQTM